MCYWTNRGGILLLLLLGLCSVSLRSAARDQSNTLVIVFKDGRRQYFPMADARIAFEGSQMTVSHDGHSQGFPVSGIVRIELQGARTSFGRDRFLGKWKVGDGVGGWLYMTLNADGSAYRAMNSSHAFRVSGSSHGTWTFVDGQARITWDDGWRDEIRRVGNKYEKLAFEPGRTFSDTPSNTADAERAEAEPL
jgi:hypothetical protein